MTAPPNATTPEAAARIERNIELGFAFLEAVLDDPSLLDGIPDDAIVAFLPDDDQELAEANMNAALGHLSQGKSIHVHGIVRHREAPAATGARTAPRLAAHALTPTWPRREDVDPKRVLIRYDRDLDRLLIDLSGQIGPDHPATGIPVGEGGHLLVDATTQVIVGFRVEGFLSHAVAKEPGLLDILAKADLHGITSAEVADVRTRLIPQTRLGALLRPFLSELAGITA